MIDWVDEYSAFTPISDNRLFGSNLVAYAPRPPPDVPSFGLEATKGANTHGEDLGFADDC